MMSDLAVQDRDIEIARATRNLKRDAYRLERGVAEWSAQVPENPARQLRWSLEIFYTTAKLEVVREILIQLEDGTDPHQVLDHIRNRALNKAAEAAHSSNPTADLMDEMERKALADVIKGMGSPLALLVHRLDQQTGAPSPQGTPA